MHGASVHAGRADMNGMTRHRTRPRVRLRSRSSVSIAHAAVSPNFHCSNTRHTRHSAYGHR
jgi:hypothetical protein